MTIKKAIKILDWWIDRKRQTMEQLKQEWNYSEQNPDSEVSKMLFDMDNTIISNLEKIKKELILNYNHPKKMRDMLYDGTNYCMNCNWEL